MIVEKNHIFNLMDTNGRRRDVLNALKIYLEILAYLKDTYPTERWGTYPASLSQFLFYEQALDRSKDVFTTHKKYDGFIDALGEDYQTFLDRDERWIENHLSEVAKDLDEGIEKRARHYTSNLVKMGFTNADRSITEAGYAYLRGSIVRDALEEILPLDNVNVALFRQLAKLKIFSAPKEGKRQYYSPFIMALVLLLDGEPVDRNTFEVIVQGLTPYCGEEVKEGVRRNALNVDQLENRVLDVQFALPAALDGKSDIEYDVFKDIFKSSKSSEAASKTYYAFFRALKAFRDERTEETYRELLKCLDGDDTASVSKAFGYGKAIFAAGNRGSRYDLARFLAENADHPLLASEDYVREFYMAYARSKWRDGIREYSDTTVRLLSATGLFRFRNLPELSYRDVLSLIFDVDRLRENVFGEMTVEEYDRYEAADDAFFGRSTSLVEIFGYSPDDVSAIAGKIERSLKVSTAADVKMLLDSLKSADFIAHIREKYPREKVMELLPLFADRRNDSRIKKEVNDTATVPTIYEYIIGIAWYYISNEEFDLYSSFNLTMNADFEPVFHALGGSGDIVIRYDELVLMLEVTLMNKQAQKRGEWEPVLRHAVNLQAAEGSKETMTFFIADELDYNTINIWRAVASVPLKSTDTHADIDGVIIMPFTNGEIHAFLEKNIYYKDIVRAVKDSFVKVPRITDAKWHEEVVAALIS